MQPGRNSGGHHSSAAYDNCRNQFLSSNFGGSYGVALALRGVTIRPSKKLQASHTFMCHFSAKGEGYGGPWFGAGSRYLGVMFYVKGHAHYGWARANFSDCRSGTLTGYAYETIANKSIKTGKTKGPDVITVQPGTLGHLARGASAIPAWRQKELVSVTH